MTHTPQHLTPTDVAQILGVSERTLSRWHALRMGPPRCKLGRRVLYRRTALEAWIEANETQPQRRFEAA